MAKDTHVHVKNDNKELFKPYNVSDKVDISSSNILWNCILDFNHSTEHKASKAL